MARLPRIVIPNIPHHITQRGNRRLPTFFCLEDYQTYVDMMSESTLKHGVQILAYCLMPNHVHLVGVPSHLNSLRLAMGEAHEKYTPALHKVF